MKKVMYKINKRGKIVIYSFLLLIILFLYICVSGKLFNLEEIVLKGNNNINKSDIMKITSIKLGNNIFKYNISKIENDILKNSYINYVEVKRMLPNKLAIDIKENTEDVVLKHDNKYVYMQSDGLILKSQKNNTNKTLPIIKGIDIVSCNVGEVIKIKDEKNLNKILNIIDELKNNNMLREINYINVEKDLVKINIKENIETILKLDESISYNVKRLKEILIDLKSDGINRGNIDLKNKEQAIYSP